MFQSYAFQCVAYQSVWGKGTPQAAGGTPYLYHPAHLREEEQKTKIKKTKTEVQKLQSVLSEYERRRVLAEESLAIAEESERNRLLKAQNELITEINRLLMVKAELMARLKREEELLVIMMIARRRLRAFHLTTKRI